MKPHNFDRLVAAMRPGVRAASVIGGVVKTYPAVAFRVDGHRYGLTEMLATNGDDPAFCEWACSAKPGDVFSEGEGCECVADLSAADFALASRFAGAVPFEVQA